MRVSDALNYEYPRPAVAVDLVVCTVADSKLQVLLIRRGQEPFVERLALPGGFVRVHEGGVGGESVDEAAARELEEETGLLRGTVALEVVGVYGAPDRDPRARVISIAYLALVAPEQVRSIRAGSDAAAAAWIPVSELVEILAFDHSSILRDCINQLQHRIDLGPMALHLMPKFFTVDELRRAFEAVKGQPYNPGNFRRKFAGLVSDGWIVPTADLRLTATKPSRLYRFHKA